jgi:hypothetical protein
MTAFDDNSDPTAYLRDLLDPAERLRVDRIEKVKTAYMTSDRDDDLARLLKRLTTNAVIRRDPTQPHGEGNRVEGKGLCIVGPSGAGKSTLLEETFRNHAAFPNFRVPGKWCPLVGITAPSPSTLAQIGIRILEIQEYAGLARELRENRVWFSVREEFKLDRTLFLWIDDMNNALTLRSEEEKQKIRDTLKDLMNNPEWPVQLIVSGIPTLLPFFRADTQLRRRFRFLYLGKLTTKEHAGFLGDAIEHYCGLAKIRVAAQVKEDAAVRLLHAADYEMGISLEIVGNAVEEALDRGSRKLEKVDFANAFADLCKSLSDDQNPFMASAWHTIDVSRLLRSADETDDTAAHVGKAHKKGKKR